MPPPTAALAPDAPADRRGGPSRPAAHRDFLDGLRALAALWVVLSHLWILAFGLIAHDGRLGLETNWVLYSHFAVDVFIVLSGFCLMLPVARDGSLRGGAGAFYARRARRILPPYYAALVISVLVRLLIQRLGHQPLEVGGAALLANAFLLQDLFLPLNVFNGPFWSIAVEWRIYFVFPLMAWALMRWGRRAVLAGAGALGGVLTLILMRLHPEMMMASPWYLFLFALGMCAGTGRRAGGPRIWPALGLSSLVALAALLRAHPVTGRGAEDFGRFMPAADIAVGGVAASLLWLADRAPDLFPLLSWRPLVFLGSFAYSIYLVHLPCLLLLRRLLILWKPGLTDPLSQAAVLACGLPLILGASYLFFLAFERPWLRRRAA